MKGLKMGKIKKTKSSATIKHLFDKYYVVQADCISKVGNIPLNGITYTDIGVNKIQLNVHTTNVKMKYIDEWDIDDFYHTILKQPEDEYNHTPENIIINNGDLANNGTIDFSVELPTDLIQETYLIGDLKLIVAHLKDQSGVTYQLLFSNCKQINWLVTLMNKSLTKRNLVSLFGILEVGLLYHSTGYQLLNYTNRSHELSSQIVSNESIVGGSYNDQLKQYHLTLVGTSIEFKQDSIKDIKIMLNQPNGVILQITLENSQLRLLLE